MFPFGANYQDLKFSGSTMLLYDCVASSYLPGLTIFYLGASYSPRLRPVTCSPALRTTNSPQPPIWGHHLSVSGPLSAFGALLRFYLRSQRRHVAFPNAWSFISGLKDCVTLKYYVTRVPSSGLLGPSAYPPGRKDKPQEVAR